jgi:serine/threonine protein kinase
MGGVAENKALKRGTVLTGRYEIADLLGEGGFGAAYLAKDLARFETRCVVKRLHSARGTSEVAHRLFEREARTLSELEHPRVPKLQAYFELRGRYYLVQDFVEGETLRAHLARTSRLDEAVVRDIVLQMLDVLEYLHSRTPPVVHRDIKPANLIFDRDGQVHLIDFGAVREAVGDASDSTETRIGTGGYAPMEQCMGHPVPASDLYALGATALNLVSGVEPRDWFEEGELVWRDRMHYSDGFAAFLEATLADLPSRVKTPAEARAILLGGGHSDELTVVKSPPVTKPTRAAIAPPPARSRRTLVWAVVGIVAAAGLVTAAILQGSRDKPPATAQVDSSAAAVAGTPAAESCAERMLKRFRTQSQFDLQILCPSKWTSYNAAEQHATRIMSSTDAAQVWASAWQPVSAQETLAQFADRWRNRMQVALGVIQMRPQPAPDGNTALYAITGERFPSAPGSLMIESHGTGGNRLFTWSIAIGVTPQSHQTVQEVLTSIEYLAPK